jgi:hypothetical protein
MPLQTYAVTIELRIRYWNCAVNLTTEIPHVHGREQLLACWIEQLQLQHSDVSPT